MIYKTLLNYNKARGQAARAKVLYSRFFTYMKIYEAHRVLIL